MMYFIVSTPPAIATPVTEPPELTVPMAVNTLLQLPPPDDSVNDIEECSHTWVGPPIGLGTASKVTNFVLVQPDFVV